jgi:hypothetical protein
VLSRWAAAQNVTGQVTTLGISFPPEFDDDPPPDPVPVYEEPGAGLRRLLGADAAVRAGLPPDDGNGPVAGIRVMSRRGCSAWSPVPLTTPEAADRTWLGARPGPPPRPWHGWSRRLPWRRRTPAGPRRRGPAARRPSCAARRGHPRAGTWWARTARPAAAAILTCSRPASHGSRRLVNGSDHRRDAAKAGVARRVLRPAHCLTRRRGCCAQRRLGGQVRHARPSRGSAVGLARG